MADWKPRGAVAAKDWVPRGAVPAGEFPGPESISTESYGPPAPPQVGPAETFTLRGAEALPAGGLVTDLLGTAVLQGAKAAGVGEPGATLTPQAQAELAAMGVDASAPGSTLPNALDAYRTLRDTRRLRSEVGSAQNKWAGRAGAGFGTALSLAAPLPGVKFAPLRGIPNAAAATRAAKVLSGGATGALYGGINAATGGEADLTRGEAGKALAETAGGTALGGLLGAGLTAGGMAASDKASELLRRAGSRLGSRLVTPSADAKALQDMGVEGLTLGQMDPTSRVGQLEGAGQASKFIGPLLKAQRSVAPDSWRSAVLNKVRAPGVSPIPSGTDVPEAMAALGQGFNKAYDKLRNVAVGTAAADRLLYATQDPLILATDADRQLVAKFLQNQLTKLPPSGTTTSVGVLQSIRSDIRDAVQREITRPSGNANVAALLERAEEMLTSGLDEALPPESAQALRATDGQYRLFKQLQRAVFQSGDTAEGSGMFTPARLSEAVRMSTPQSVHAAGGGGPLRGMAATAKRAFREPPQTGFTAVAANALTAAPIWALNQPLGQEFLKGRAPAELSGMVPSPQASGRLAGELSQQAMQGIENWLSTPSAAALLRKKRKDKK